MKHAPLIVLYHDISEGSNPLLDQLNVSTKPEVFEKHLCYFNRNYDIISIGDLLSGTLPKRPLLITFDDAYRSVVDTGGPILKAHDNPSIFFINPSPIKEKAIPIDNLICLACNLIGFESTRKLIDPFNIDSTGTESLAFLIGTLLPMLPLEKRNNAKANLLEAMATSNESLIRENPIYLIEEDFKKMPAMRMDVGNHTYSHTHMRILDRNGRDHEIKHSKNLLDALAGNTIKSLSVPYGDSKDAPPAVLDTVRESGHDITFLVHGRMNNLRPAPDVYYRVSLHNEPINKFPIKLRLLPALRTVKSLLKRK